MQAGFGVVWAIPLALTLSVQLCAQSGVATTLAGSTPVNGVAIRGYGGDGGLARKAALALANQQNECEPARFEQISHLAADSAGNVWLTDSANHRVRRIDTRGVITTVAGSGVPPPLDGRPCPTAVDNAIGDGGPATAARLAYPAGIALHPNGGLIVADQQQSRVRQVSANGTITTIAGNGLHAFYAPQIPAINSGIDWPTAVAVSPEGLVYFSELHSGRVARIGADGRLVTVAGTGIPGFNGESGAATSIRLQSPTGIGFDSSGNLYIADQGNHRVRKVTPGGALSTIAGTGTAGFAGDGGPATAALLNRPADVKIDARGNIFVSDMNNHRVRRINAGGIIETVAGTGVPIRGSDGVAAPSSALSSPTGLAVDAAGDVRVVDWGNALVRAILFSGRPVIASGGVLNSADFGPGPVARGGLFTLFGMNLADLPSSATTAPWPLELGGITVRVNGQPVPLNFAGPTQINAQMPYSVGLETEAAVVVSQANRGSSALELVTVASANVAAFVYPGSRRAIAVNQDGTLNSPANAEGRGRVITVYVTGIGAVTPELPTGEAAPLDRLHLAAVPVSAKIGGVTAPLLFLGLAPGFIGLGQANIQIPSGAASGGDVALDLGAGGAAMVSIR